jgi:hypothetical protein
VLRISVAGELVEHQDAREDALRPLGIPFAQAARDGLVDGGAEALPDLLVEGLALDEPFAARLAGAALPAGPNQKSRTSWDVILFLSVAGMRKQEAVHAFEGRQLRGQRGQRRACVIRQRQRHEAPLLAALCRCRW